jgi:hypothetical protein
VAKKPFGMPPIRSPRSDALNTMCPKSRSGCRGPWLLGFRAAQLSGIGGGCGPSYAGLDGSGVMCILAGIVKGGGNGFAAACVGKDGGTGSIMGAFWAHWWAHCYVPIATRNPRSCFIYLFEMNIMTTCIVLRWRGWTVHFFPVSVGGATE